MPAKTPGGYAYTYTPPTITARVPRRRPLTRADVALRIVLAVTIAAALFFAMAVLSTPSPIGSMVQCAVCFACAAGYAGLLILCRPAA